LEFDQFGWASLSQEAERQGVSREELLKHAAMYYLADLDSGRVAARILRGVEREPGDTEQEPGARRFERREDEPDG
jgi:hypothetical protein